MTRHNSSIQRKRQANNPGFIGLIKRLIKVTLLIGIGYLLYVYATDNNSQQVSRVISYLDNSLSNSTNYLKLINQDPPQPNSLPSPITGAHLTDTWGAARSGGRSHEGIDIFAPRGTPIHSTTPGIVRKVGINTLGGNIVSILGPGRVGHYYAHLEAFADIEPGDWVEAGDVIGYVGDSGNAKGTPPHVHYGIYMQSGAVNPYPLLVK